MIHIPKSDKLIIMKEVEVYKIKYNPPSKSYAVLLSVLNSEKVAAIPVGTEAANTISMAYNGNSFPRPFTHDILLSIIDNLNSKVSKVIINDIRKGTIFSKIILNNHQKNEISIDCRPSDAIIVAIKSYARIFIEDHVIEKLENSDIDVLKYTNSDNTLSNDNNELSDNLYSALELQLKKAIDNEEYEIAAKIRDRINQIDKK